MTRDGNKLLFIIAYAGSDAGKNALDDFLIEIRHLRAVADAARAIVTGYPSYPSWGAAEQALHDALEALGSSQPSSEEKP